ncbi:flagellar operon protein [Oribacterium sp. KHPX15]|uniref:TIGR02530 family flagellar biosynthesis protein n=1 Tax=Oribacterium sp. KHPX15 TaxID=1855342 RepID=UPI00089C78DA|nr:TIGR02530 family flagellar biosynthesis protein [Oribacterium sp. KHPX15]SEA42115.1 flagellar operon protein [Oribacterium sp. KHPX15]
MDFDLTSRRLQSVEYSNLTKSRTEAVNTNDTGTSFQEQLTKLQNEAKEDLSFSKHAVRRLEERNIEMNDGLMDDLRNAVSEAKKKGAKDVAVIGRQGIFIVNVPNNVVVTTMAEDDMRNKTLTNIDSAVFM